ncbi:MAG: hypothetical protein AAFX54_06355 [Pseudomonadota bacterium]
MNFKLFFAAALSAGVMTSASSAGELADACVAALEAEGRDTSGCTCLEEQVVANDLADEMLALGEIADPADRYEAASPAAKAAMDMCTR